MALKLTWVNHASFILSDGIASIISDPWLEGTAFNDGWKLLSPTALQYDDFKNITHIWFSHEHPDHFAPNVIRKIPSEYRENITVLYQNTVDHKVKDFCKAHGFKAVIEIKPDDKIKISPSITVSCQKVKNDIDSWMLIETPGMRILNLNDCHFDLDRKSVEEVKSIVGEIDILLTQFSFAHWAGNRDRTDIHQNIAQKQINEMKLQTDVFKPKMIIPFASYVWFCHEENHYLNKFVNRIRDVYKMIPDWGNYVPMVFYPGDVWDMTEKWEKSENAIERYEKDFNKIMTSPDLVKSNKISLDELKNVGEDFRKRCMKDNNAKKILSFAPFTVYLTDYASSFQFSFRKGLEEINVAPENADVSMSSQSLWYCLKFDWGFATTHVAARYEKPIHGNYQNVNIYYWVADLRNKGMKVPYLLERILVRLKGALSKA